ncbi:MAG: hypothetical protein M9887_07630 [Chitinophagales bacterium]|nr:hypothetical protein [Chitinophagales bacterium]
MRTLTIAFSFIFICISLFSCKKTDDSHTISHTTDDFTVNVNNGYGSGKYKEGDTVHIFSMDYNSDQIFDTWSGSDVQLLNAPDEWHAWFIMPAKDVSFTGNLQNIQSYTLQYEQIMGKDRLKPVYYYFPEGQKGIVYLLHGTDGSASNLVASYEWQQIIKDLVNNKFAVMITEAEESTTGVDNNGDGKLRWNLLPLDTVNNVDYANIRLITNVFYDRGYTDSSKLKYSIGMSDGGFFSAALSYIYNFKASVQYCAQGGDNLMQITTIPTQFCMAANDNNPSVGMVGNAVALSNSQALNNRGICSKYLINSRSPIYPERFARSGTMSIGQSSTIFDELKSKGFIDNKNYFIGYSDSFTSAYANNPLDFPIFKSLTVAQKLSVLSEINLSVSDHHIYNDFNKSVLKFLNNQCL